MKKPKRKPWVGNFYYNNRACYLESIPVKRLDLKDEELLRRWGRDAVKASIDLAKEINSQPGNDRECVPVVIRRAVTIHGSVEPERLNVIREDGLSWEHTVFGAGGQDKLFRATPELEATGLRAKPAPEKKRRRLRWERERAAKVEAEPDQRLF